MELHAMRGRARACGRSRGRRAFIARPSGSILLRRTLPRYQKGPRAQSILAPYVQAIEDLLEEDDYRATMDLRADEELGLHRRLRHREAARPDDQGAEDSPGLRPVRDRARPPGAVRLGRLPGGGAIGPADDDLRLPLVLGFSRADYVEFVERTTLEVFMDGHIRAFHALGGVPAEILYDNMKLVVGAATRRAGPSGTASSSTSPTTTASSPGSARPTVPGPRARWKGRSITSGRASGGATASPGSGRRTRTSACGSPRRPTAASTARISRGWTSA